MTRKPLRILSWNVNGIRACARHGFLTFLEQDSPDILCCQETKAAPAQVPSELLEPGGYRSFWNAAARAGYSGVATFLKQEPDAVRMNLSVKGFDDDRFGLRQWEPDSDEGRVVITEQHGFELYNVYFPNGKQSEERLGYKLGFYEAFLKYLRRQVGKKIVVAGDFNTAHKEIDLARPKENSKVSGFLPVEREWLDRLVAAGFVDTFRMFHSEPGQYTWWNLMTRARERNVGWRIDYLFVSSNLESRVKDAFILPDVTGSDHCPVGIRLDP